LPPTLVSSLESLITDIGSYGDPVSSLDEAGGAKSKPILTIDDAVRYASVLKDE
jgi:hypothetical protein